MVERTGTSPALRTVLREETAQDHDRLDRSLGVLAFGGQADYARFLAIQHAARIEIERWLERVQAAHARMPAMAPLIAADLDALGQPLPMPLAWQPPQECDPIGAQWVLAGSSMGNRAILAQRRKLGLQGPDTFLSDTSMPEFFRTLLPALAEPVQDEDNVAPVSAARAVFKHFLRAAEIEPERRAA